MEQLNIFSSIELRTMGNQRAKRQKESVDTAHARNEEGIYLLLGAVVKQCVQDLVAPEKNAENRPSLQDTEEAERFLWETGLMEKMPMVRKIIEEREEQREAAMNTWTDTVKRVA